MERPGRNRPGVPFELVECCRWSFRSVFSKFLYTKLVCEVPEATGQKVLIHLMNTSRIPVLREEVSNRYLPIFLFSFLEGNRLCVGPLIPLF